ncbi:MAG: 50S ribosomal protein L11 methyltransferase [Lachnospiraceae bacterium]|nr:50S ribosomal protein L11 methyltransferase [Lachnospiraceae bacterium]
MDFIKIRIKTNTLAADIIISSLYDLGLEGAEIEDKQPLSAMEKEQMFVDLTLDEPFDDGIAYLNFYLEACEGQDEGQDESLSILLKEINDELNGLRDFLDIGEGSITVSEVKALDWSENWKQYFRQFAVDDILIVPSWEEASSPNAHQYLLRIDPGAAFGTGKHETTQLCIRQLKKHIKPGQRLLDIGCGSGILGILSLMFGAKLVYGTDLDPNALAVTEENCRANGILPEQLKVFIGNIISDEQIFKAVGGEESFDIVVSNIIAEVLIMLTPVAYRLIKKGGLLIFSGIYENEDKVVAALIAVGMKIIEINRQGEWVSVTALKES